MNSDDDDAIIFQDSNAHIGIPEPSTVSIDTIFQCKTYIIEALLEIIADGLKIKEHHKLIFIQKVNALFSSLYIQPSGTHTEVSKQVILQVRLAIEEFMAATIKNFQHTHTTPPNNNLSIIPSSDSIHLPLEIILKNLKSKFSNDFEVVDNIGKGAYGNVLKVKKKTNKKEYAVKIITLRNSKADGLYSNREIERLMNLDHPNIVKFYDYWSEYSIEEADSKSHDNSDNSDSMNSELVADGTLGISKAINSLYKNVKVFIQMELCQTTLSHFLRHRSALNHSHNWSLVQQLLMAVHYLHESQIVHRDLKPDNVLVNTDNTNNNTPPILKLTDFGLSRKLPARFSFTGSSVDAIGHVSDCNEDGDEEEDSFDDDDSDGYDNDAVKVDVTTSDVQQQQQEEECTYKAAMPLLKLTDYGFPKELSHRLKDSRLNHHRPHHRLKPPNITAASDHDKLTHDLGTQPFIAPEVLHYGKDYGFKVDVYAAGMISCKVFWLATTEQEMAVTLRRLKDGEMDEEECQNEVGLVKWLTQASPCHRPTAIQALNSQHFQNEKIEPTSLTTAIKIPSPTTPLKTTSLASTPTTFTTTTPTNPNPPSPTLTITTTIAPTPNLTTTFHNPLALTAATTILPNAMTSTIPIAMKTTLPNPLTTTIPNPTTTTKVQTSITTLLNLTTTIATTTTARIRPPIPILNLNKCPRCSILFT